MKHLGDITKINGAEVEPVWVIIGGSPCQDLSVAGKRAGLAGARSGLFMEQIRVIKEMRQHERDTGRTNEFIRPRYMVWENVPGAFSSNKGEDFRAVLEETARIADGNADVPQPPNGKWSNAGCIMGNGWSIAWRVHDAQFWGVPQRRRRISFVADFGGQSAPEILFERKGVSGDIAESGTTRERVAANAERSTDTAIAYSFDSLASNSMKSKNPHSGCRAVEVAKTLDTTSPDPSKNQGGICICIQGNCIDRTDTAGCNGKGWTEDVSYTLNTIDRPAVFDARGNGGGVNNPAICVPDIDRPAIDPVTFPGIGITSKENASKGTPELCHTLNQDSRNYVVAGFSYKASPGAGSVGYAEEQAPTILGERQDASVFDARGNGNGAMAPTLTGDHQNRVTDYTAVAVGAFQNTGRGWWNESDIGATIRTPCGGDSTKANLVGNNQSVRRLTPLECERLQGYPDGWTDIPGASDSARYKALGNSIALPFWRWMLNRMSTYLPADATLGSLFDGIGGFPLIWEEIHGKGTARWASEIEPIPIRVTEYHFGGLNE